MSRLRYFTKRIAGFIFSITAIFTLTFLYIEATPYTEPLLQGEGSATTADASLIERYVDWLIWALTVPNSSVVDPIVESLTYTLVYLVPALVVAIAVGTGVRMYTVSADRSRLDKVIDILTILAVSIPVFLIAFLLRDWSIFHYFARLEPPGVYPPMAGALSARGLPAAALSATVMTFYLLAIQLRYAGEELRQYASAEFVKTARAKGASTLRVGRHVFQNTAVSLLTLFFTDMFGTVVVGVFVIEFVTGAPGIGALMIEAVLGSDIQLILGITLFIVLVGVVANFLQDIAHLLHYPQVEFGE